jgi:hypothetical protein
MKLRYRRLNDEVQRLLDMVASSWQPLAGFFERRGIIEALARLRDAAVRRGRIAPPADPPRGEGAPPARRPGQSHITSKSAPPSVGKT